MKKIIAILLSLMLLLGAASALAESAERVTLGTVSINGEFILQCGLPEGYNKPIPILATAEHMIATIKSEDPDAPVMTLSIAYDETYSDVQRMNDLDAEALTLLEQTYIVDDPGVEITYGETGYGTLLLIARHETDKLDYVSFLSVYRGYFVEFVLTPSEHAADKNLTEEQLKVSVDFLTDLDFIPADRPMTGSQSSIAGGTFLTNLSDYNAEDNTLQAEIRHRITLTPAAVAALEVGGTLKLGQESIKIETLVRDGDTTVVNDEIYLETWGSEVRAYFYDMEYMETTAVLTLKVPEGLIFLDHIDPASGESLETPTEHTAEEFVAMLASGEAPDFSSDNVYVIYDENGEMAQIDRYYTPWQ